MKKNLLSKTKIVLLLGMLVSMGFSACSKSGEEPISISQTYERNFIPAISKAEFQKLTQDRRVNMVRSYTQLETLITNKQTPLYKVNPKALSEFLASLVFTNNGLAGLQYGMLKEELSEEDLFQVIAMFGIDAKEGFWGIRGLNSMEKPKSMNQVGELIDLETDTDYVEYWCKAPKSCVKKADGICTSNC